MFGKNEENKDKNRNMKEIIWDDDKMITLAYEMCEWNIIYFKVKPPLSHN